MLPFDLTCPREHNMARRRLLDVVRHRFAIRSIVCVLVLLTLAIGMPISADAATDGSPTAEHSVTAASPVAFRLFGLPGATVLWATVGAVAILTGLFAATRAGHAGSGRGRGAETVHPVGTI